MHLDADSLDWRWGIDSPPSTLVLMQSALCSLSVPPAHRNWLIAVLSCLSQLGVKFSVDPTKLIIGSSCALIIFARTTSVRLRCFQFLVEVLIILFTTPSQLFWLMAAWSKQKCIPIILIVFFIGIPIVADLIPSSSISGFSLLTASPEPVLKFSMMQSAFCSSASDSTNIVRLSA
jgi:hypothetical protein